LKSPVIPSIRTHDQKAFMDDVKRALDSIRGYYKGKDTEQGQVVVTKVPTIITPLPPIPPPTPTPPGPLPAGWIDLNTQIGTSSFFGYNPSASAIVTPAFIATGGQGYDFYIDPVSVGFTSFGGPKPYVCVGDILQGTDCAPHLYLLDSSYTPGTEISMEGGNAQYSSRYPKGYVWNGEPLLLHILPAADMSMLVFWCMA